MKAVISLGSNLGDSVATLARASDELAALGEIVASSSLYRSAPWGPVEQPEFLNSIVVLSTELTPQALLERLHEIEASFERTRELRWGPRTLDLDIVCCDELELDTENLVLPHPRAHLRAFVLLPWSEVEPDARVPGRGTLVELLPTVIDQDVERVA